jgi:hypothetical protein
MMRTRTSWMGALVGALVLAAAPALAQVTISIDSGVVPVDGTAVVNISLAGGGASVGGMQNDIIFNNTIVNLTGAGACVINPAIGLFPGGNSCLDDSSVGPCKNLSRVLNVCGGSPQPEGCPAGAGSDTSVFRGIIAATAAPNNNDIPDGVLYTCTFNVVGTLPADLAIANVVVSDPTGTRLDSTGVSGSIGEGGEVTPTPEPTTPPVEGVVVDIGDDPGTGATAVIDVNLVTDGESVGGMQNDIIFDNTIVNLNAAGDCVINPAIGLFPGGSSCLDDTSVGPCKNLSRVLNVCGGSPQAEGCPAGAGTNISVFRGIIAATAAPNNNEIPDGVLYTCTFQIVNAGALPTTLQASNVVVSDPFGVRLDAGGLDGVVGEGPAPTATPTEEVSPTNTPVTPVAPTNTPVTPVSPTNTPPQATQTATATAGEETPEICQSTVAVQAASGAVTLDLVNGDCFPEDGGTILLGTATPLTLGYTERVGNQLFLSSPLPQLVAAGTTVTLVAGAGDDDDGCHINAGSSNSRAWMLLIPALGALVLRRRRW